MSDKHQEVVNRLSIVMTIDAEIVKACRDADLPPMFIEILTRLHNQQLELEKTINEQAKTMLNMAQTIDMIADHTTHHAKAFAGVINKLGYSEEDLVTATEVGQGELQ